MDRRKLIYIGSLLILTVIVSVTYFSYAFFTNKSEQRGKINVVAGTLDYELVSNDLTNNSITIPADTTKTIEIEIKSLNTIESKYELYYEVENENVIVGYSSTTIDEPTGTISAKSSKKVTVIIKNKTNITQTITFGTQGGFSNKELILAQGDSLEEIAVCDLNTGYTFEFPFDPDGDGNGQIQTFNTPCDGYYKLETWGAQGGTYSSSLYGGYGGYSEGITYLTTTDELYVVVGQKGFSASNNVTNLNGGYNGGGYSYHWRHNDVLQTSGGGATHIAMDSGLLSDLSTHASDDRILIVSGAGGGAAYGDNQNFLGGHAGGYIGNNGQYKSSDNSTYGYGGTQTSGGSYYAFSGWVTNPGSFGAGGSSISSTGGASGGGGYYGGGGAAGHDGAGGGSSYIANSKLFSKSMYCYDCTEDLTNADTFTVRTNGTSVYRDTTNCANGYSTDPISKCAKLGNGYAKITYLGEGNVTTLYSAAVDEVYYYDSNSNRQVIGTTDATGKLENVFIPNGVRLYSSIAKDPNNLSNPYSKAFNTISNETYLMPDGEVLYWYGYDKVVKNFDRTYSGATPIPISSDIKNTNDWRVTLNWQSGGYNGCTYMHNDYINSENYSSYKMIINSASNRQYNAASTVEQIYYSGQSTLHRGPSCYTGPINSPVVWAMDITGMNSVQVGFRLQVTSSGPQSIVDIAAMWLE